MILIVIVVRLRQRYRRKGEREYVETNQEDRSYHPVWDGP